MLEEVEIVGRSGDLERRERHLMAPSKTRGSYAKLKELKMESKSFDSSWKGCKPEPKCRIRFKEKQVSTLNLGQELQYIEQDKKVM